MLLAIFVALAIVLLALLQSCAPAVEPPTGPLGPNSSYEQGQGQAQKGGGGGGGGGWGGGGGPPIWHFELNNVTRVFKDTQKGFVWGYGPN
ncbi:hypothetical protein AB6D97_21345, partial [Vibrio sp. 10N.247.310.34]